MVIKSSPLTAINGGDGSVLYYSPAATIYSSTPSNGGGAQPTAGRRSTIDNSQSLASEAPPSEYDEVFSSSNNTTNNYSCSNVELSPARRRWSSSSVLMHSACLSGSSGCTDAAEHSNHYSPTVATNAPSHWHIPLPSRRLLAEPLPPLPSIGPSTAGSMTGTLSSSRASSSLPTPDESTDCRILADDDRTSLRSLPYEVCLLLRARHDHIYVPVQEVQMFIFSLFDLLRC